jgi:lambda family phage portal protein
VRVPRETSWGRANVIHIFEHEKDGQTRGRGGILAALTRAKMLDKHEQAHLQQSILSAVYAMFVTSPLGQDSIGQALGAGQGIDANLASYLAAKTDFHKEANVKFNGVRIPHLFPGEKIEHSKPAHPSANFESFERIFHRYIAASLNMTYEQFTKDYSQTNYSGHRAALLDYWRFVTGRRSSISGKFAGAIYVLWLEEFLDSGGLDGILPKGAPAFWDAKAAWTRHEWIGPGQGQIDPLKEANATMVEFQCGVTTLEAECAARGKDWRAVLIQRAQEAAEAKRLETQYGLEPGSLDYAKGASPAPPGPDGGGDTGAPPAKKEPAPTPEPANA